jgi:hypothetical protein
MTNEHAEIIAGLAQVGFLLFLTLLVAIPYALATSKKDRDNG